jgi:hypothetical protein
MLTLMAKDLRRAAANRCIGVTRVIIFALFALLGTSAAHAQTSPVPPSGIRTVAAPLVMNASTGNLSCPMCTGGTGQVYLVGTSGIKTVAAPLAVDAAGDLSCTSGCGTGSGVSPVPAIGIRTVTSPLILDAAGNLSCPSCGAGPITSVVCLPELDTSIVCTWSTGASSLSSNATCSGKAAADNGLWPNSTSHMVIVTGLTAGATVSCTVSSGVYTSAPQSVTLDAAQTRIPISQVALGTSITAGPQSGDSLITFLSSDGHQYMNQDDGTGCAASPNAGANMQICTVDNLSTLVGANVNILSAYGGINTFNGTDGPGGIPQTNKTTGVFGLGGSLFQFQHRQSFPGGVANLLYGNIMGDHGDHGATWNSWQAPAVYNANGIPPSPLGSFQFANGNIGAALGVRYAADDDTIGYTTSGNTIDGANGWVYMVYNSQGDFNDAFLMRCLRFDLLYNNCTRSGSVQYWTGPASSSMTPAAFVNDSNFSSSGASSATACFTQSLGSLTTFEVDFIPGLNRYLGINLYRANGASAVWQFYDGVTPCGPWTPIAQQADQANGWYYPSVAHSTFAGNASTSAIPLTLFYSGASALPTYGLHASDATLLPATSANMQQLSFYSCTLTENPVSDGGNLVGVTGYTPLQSVPPSCYAASSGFAVALYTAPPNPGDTGASFPPDQCTDEYVRSINSTGYTGQLVRFSTSGTGYFGTTGPSGTGPAYIFKATGGGARTQIATAAATVSTGDIWRTCAIGTTISLWQQPANTVGFSEIISVTDSDYASGLPGFGAQGTSADTDSQIGLFTVEANQASAPVFSTYAPGFSGNVTITCPTSGSTVYYTYGVSATQPTRSSSTLACGGTVAVTPGHYLAAMAVASDYADSQPVTVGY